MVTKRAMRLRGCRRVQSCVVSVARLARESGPWIPACAGMTEGGVAGDAEGDAAN